MKKSELRQIIRETIIQEFLGDLKKQCVVLMGLPAAGKSTFINNDIQTYIPGFKNYKISNSDNLVRSLQYQVAKQHYEKLKTATEHLKDQPSIEKEISKLKFKTKYLSNRGKMVEIPMTYDWWVDNKDKGFNTYWKAFFKPYYGSYFDIRDLAQSQERKLFATKIKESSSLIVIDTTAANSSKILERLEATKENDFYNTIIYLEIDPELSIVRDKYREETEGRGVGENVILGYSKRMDGAFNEYKKAATKGTVDRLMRFKWTPAGDSPIKGTWTKVSDNRFNLKRKKK